METIVSQKMSRGQGNELLNKLEAAGLNDELAQRVIDSKANDLGTKLVRFIRDETFEPSTSHKQARAIMGKNFFGIEEAIKYFGVNPSKQKVAYLAKVPFTEEVLKSCTNTHVLVAMFPMSILNIRGKVERNLFYSHDDARYNKQAFAQDKGEVSWHLVRKVPIADSTNKTWNEQQALLSKDEETPTVRIVVYTMVGHFLAAGERLFENIYVRCSDLDSDGRRVGVGSFASWGLFVNAWRDDHRDGDIGLSGVRKQ